MKLDKKDHSIIGVLKKDSRLPIRQIAKKTGIRPSTVHERIKKLTREKVIKNFTIRLNDKAMHQNFTVFMLIKGGTKEYINENIINNKHVKDIFGVTGEYDLLLKLKFEDVEDFNRFLIKFRREQKNIKSTFTMVSTVKIKEEI